MAKASPDAGRASDMLVRSRAAEAVCLKQPLAASAKDEFDESSNLRRDRPHRRDSVGRGDVDLVRNLDDHL